MKFEWDENKRLKNIQKHRIDFKDILDIFNRPMLERVDDRQDYGEERIICLGLSHLVENPTVVVVVYVEKINDIIRIISARKALKYEQGIYYKKIFS